MQNNALLYVVGAVIVVAAGVGVWMYGGSMTSTDTGDENATEQTSKSTLKGLLAYNGSQKCTFTTSDDTYSSSGTVYISSGKMRGDFVSTADGHTSNSHMIVEGTTSYIWTDEMAQGFKMSFDAMSSGQSSQNQAVDPNAEVDYNCSAWSADQSLFALPTNITFQDMSAIAPPGAGASGDASVSGSAAQCASCDQAPNEGARAQCRAALQCE